VSVLKSREFVSLLLLLFFHVHFFFALVLEGFAVDLAVFNRTKKKEKRIDKDVSKYQRIAFVVSWLEKTPFF
jgi:hypothetical protein